MSRMARVLPILLLTLGLVWTLQSAWEIVAAGPAEGGAAPPDGPAPAAAAGPGARAAEAPVPFTWQEAYQGTGRPSVSSKGPNVHRSDLHCVECHGQGTPAASNLLFDGDDVSLCRSCHPRSVYNVHVVGVRPKEVEVPEEFPLSQGRLTCVTCHDEPSCNAPDHPSRQRPFFLRGEKTGFDFCFSCHSAAGYESYNPHDTRHLQSAAERRNNCLFCHTAELPAESRRGLRFAALKGDPDDLCTACHVNEPHFGIPAHLEVKREVWLERLAEAARKAGPSLPLGEDSAMLCVSCHDPHMPGLIPHEEGGRDVWIQVEGDSELRRRYLEEGLYPFVREKVAELESRYGRTLIIREPGLFHEKDGLVRGRPKLNGSLCLWCHDVFQEDPSHGPGSRLDYRMLH
ncbi:MAG: hypothetical protein AB1640_11445 [bacterium]